MLLNPIVSKFVLTAGVPQEVYVCPTTKSHAIIDLSFFKNSLGTSSRIAVALTSETNPAALTTVDYFIDDIELVNDVTSAELTKVVVGKGERLFIQVMEGASIAVRVSGIEENNSKALKAGRLGAASVAGTQQTQVFGCDCYPTAAYVSASLTIFNVSETENAPVEVWISSAETPTDADKVMMIRIPMQDTTIVENMLLLPNERIFVKSDVGHVEYFANGLVIAQ